LYRIDLDKIVGQHLKNLTSNDSNNNSIDIRENDKRSGEIIR